MTEQKVLEVLNDVFQRDRQSVLALLSLTVPTNEEILDEYPIRVSGKGYIEFGLLTLINKMIEDSGKEIEFDYLTTGNSVMVPKGFRLTERKR